MGGQSNALGDQIFPGFVDVLEQKLPGVELSMIRSTRGASPIERWDEDFDDTWPSLVDAIESAESEVAGMIWYQGEENCFEPDGYEDKLRSLVARLRAAVGDPNFVFILVQLANNTGNGKAPNLAILREHQLRYGDSDPRVATIPALDSSMNDYVHITSEARQELGRRAGFAALRLRYGLDCAAIPGPRLVRQSFRDASRREVVVEFEHVYGALELEERGWENSFGVLPDGMTGLQGTAVPSSAEFFFESRYLIFPERITASGTEVTLTFAEPLSEEAALGFGIAGNQRIAQPFGDDRAANTPMAGLHDAEGFPPPAYFPRPIEPSIDASR
ncbi:MAG: sialate O-acetylesterase [Myxococcota bacterium]